jgi:perosamine synthetase
VNEKVDIPLMIPDILNCDIEAVVRILKTGMLVQGPEVEKLERTIAEYLGVEHVIAVSNGTATMHIALKILGIEKGDEVIVPAFSYIATANVVELVGAKPVFVDIDSKTSNINVDQVERAITKKTKAIIPVHEFGLACDIGPLCEIAKSHDLHVIEDAACALGATFKNRFVGTFGEFGSFSLHPRKAITSGEGGLITTSNRTYAEKCRQLRNHGIQRNGNGISFVDAGFNYRMTDFQAALVLSQFERFPKLLEKKEELARIYLTELAGIDRIELPSVETDKRHTWQTFHIVLDQSVDRGRLIKDLQNRGIGTNYGAQCIPAEQFYLKYNLNCEKQFPIALKSARRGLALPIYDRLTASDVKTVCKALKDCLNA